MRKEILNEREREEKKQIKEANISEPTNQTTQDMSWWSAGGE